MKSGERFFTAEMGTRLRELRLKAGLLQDDVAERMGLTGKGRSNFISALERGAVKRPYLDAIASYLRVCGTRMSASSELLDRIEYLPAPSEEEKRGAEGCYTRSCSGVSGTDTTGFDTRVSLPVS